MIVYRPETSLKRKVDITLGHNMYCLATLGLEATAMTQSFDGGVLKRSFHQNRE